MTSTQILKNYTVLLKVYIGSTKQQGGGLFYIIFQLKFYWFTYQGLYIIAQRIAVDEGFQVWKQIHISGG